MIIGLTGLYCAGKNHVAKLLENRGFPVLDADKLGHEVIQSEAEKIVDRFGKAILGPDGQIDRRLLGKRVFGQSDLNGTISGRAKELAALEAIIHPGVNALAEKWINSRSGHCVINAALLQKSSVFEKLEAIIVVHAPFPVRFLRALKRDNLPLRELMHRFQSQKGFPRYDSQKSSAQLFSCSADIYNIRNSGFPGSGNILEKRIDAILEGLHYGKEKIAAGSGISGSISGGRGERRDPGF